MPTTQSGTEPWNRSIKSAAAYAKRFTGRYEHRLFKGGIGHNPPQEAPQDFAKTVIDADRL